MSRRPAKKRTSVRRTSSETGTFLWLVPFTFDRPKAGEHGSFQIVVTASDPDDAMDRCHRRLRELHATTLLFKGPVMIYSDALLRLDGSFPQGVLANFQVAREHGSITNLMPEQGMHEP